VCQSLSKMEIKYIKYTRGARGAPLGKKTLKLFLVAQNLKHSCTADCANSLHGATAILHLYLLRILYLTPRLVSALHAISCYSCHIC